MTPNIIILFVAIVILLFIINRPKNRPTKTTNIANDIPKEDPKTIYHYRARKHLMTYREGEFFITLNDILSSRFYIIPQVHLSALLNHELKGQNWKGAFAHINGKSVDYVLLNKKTCQPVCAIELDDSTHDSKTRQARDQEVERIFAEVKIPLVRLRNPEKMTKQEIIHLIADTMKSNQ